MSLNSFTVTGSCQINGRGVFEASLIEADEFNQRCYYSCSNHSLNKVLHDMYVFLLGPEQTTFISSKRVNKITTAKQQRKKVIIKLNLLDIHMMTTKKPAVTWFKAYLPFDKQSTDLLKEEEV